LLLEGARDRRADIGLRRVDALGELLAA